MRVARVLRLAIGEGCLKAAARLALHDTANLAQMASDLGSAGQAHFNRHLRRMLGVSLGEDHRSVSRCRIRLAFSGRKGQRHRATTMLEPGLSLLLGFAFGLRHACEPDHVAAVSNLSLQKSGLRAGFQVGALWGIGHAFSVFALGGTLAVLETQMPLWCSQGFEFAVGVMLIVLGIRSVLRAFRQGRSGSVTLHQHGAHHHAHPNGAAHVHLFQVPLASGPLAVGMLHGLAGSGALAALAIPTLPTAVARLQYVALFGLGSTVGMGLLSMFLSVPLSGLRRIGFKTAHLVATAGLCSAGFGVYWCFLALQSHV